MIIFLENLGKEACIFYKIIQKNMFLKENLENVLNNNELFIIY